MTFHWNDFVRVLRDTELEFHHLKPVQLAQAILESGRGGSDLFQLHGNPFGMKYRHEMNTIAVPIQYTAHDGVDVYCKFDNLQDAVDGYWQFIDRPVYSGWRTSVATAEDYILFIAFAGYVGGDDAAKQQYVNKINALLAEANSLLQSTPEPSAATAALWQKNGVLLEVAMASPPAAALTPVRSGSTRRTNTNSTESPPPQPNG